MGAPYGRRFGLELCDVVCELEVCDVKISREDYADVYLSRMATQFDMQLQFIRRLVIDEVEMLPRNACGRPQELSAQDALCARACSGVN